MRHQQTQKGALSLMSKSITQDMRYRQSLMQYAEKYGVSRASRKYNKSRSYIYFWKARWDGSVESLACQSRRPHHHPNQHTEAELKLIRDMRRRNPTLGMVELWHRLRKRGYTRRPLPLYPANSQRPGGRAKYLICSGASGIIEPESLNGRRKQNGKNNLCRA